MCIAAIALLAAIGVFSGKAGDDDEAPAWSPDGRRISFMSDRDGNLDIFTMNPDGSDVEQLTKNPFSMLWQIFTWIDRSFDGYPDWSPDGEHIVFFSGRNNGFMASVETDLIIMDRDGTNAKNITLDTYASEYFPSWSPRGDRIAFHSNVGSEKYDIYLRSVDGTGLKRLTTDPSNDTQAAWSPSGDQIAFTSDRNSEQPGQFHIFVMNSDGSNQNQLTTGDKSNNLPAWSPDGSRIAFSSDRDGDWEIYIMDTNGSNLVQLTNDPADDSQPSWSPDGKQLAFMSDRDGDFDIYIMDVDGANVVQLTGK
jgi:Tol biopolymer transport system component